MKWPAMGYTRARNLDDLWHILDTSDGDTQIIAGGQSLLAGLAFRLSEPSLLVDITHIDALKGITLADQTLRIGSLTCHAELGRNNLVAAHVPMLKEAAPLIAHPAIRNRGTVGGSLALADPAAELPACMVALQAHLVLVSARGERRVAAQDFFLGLFETALEADEIIASVEVPCITAKSHQTIKEITRRSGDYAMAGLALSMTIESNVIKTALPVYFGVGSAPVLAKGAAAALYGQALSESVIKRAQDALDRDLDPPADLHGGPDFKRHLAKVLLKRTLESCLSPKEMVA